MTGEYQAAHFRNVGILAQMMSFYKQPLMPRLMECGTLCEEQRARRETTSLQTLEIIVQVQKQIEPTIINIAEKSVRIYRHSWAE